MIQLTTIESLKRAIENAKASDLLVRQTSIFRQYEVINRTKGTQYTVKFFVRDGQRFADCTCKAGQHGMRCKHVAAAAGLHVMVAAAKAQVSH